MFNFGLFVYCREKVPIERSRDDVLDMNQFRMLFNTCKVPGITRDSVYNYFKTGKQIRIVGYYKQMILCWRLVEQSF